MSLIGYLYTVLGPLLLVFSKMNDVDRDEDKDKNNNLISFGIDDKKLFEKYKTI